MVRPATLALLLPLLWPVPARAHHEAIFGPHSSLAMSSPSFLTFQGFTRNTGSVTHSQETTLVLGGGFAPWHHVPLSFTAVLPASYITGAHSHAGAPAPSAHEDVAGLEDLIVAARFRIDVPALQRRFGKEGNFLLAMAGVELPTGTVDHAAFDAPLDGLAALLASVERGPFSGILYGFGRLHGSGGSGTRDGHLVFVGGGAALTPWDEPDGRLVSLQLGWSIETHFRDREGGAVVDASGGQALLVHPALVFGPGGRWLLFAMGSLPLLQDRRDPEDRDRWRAGAGLIYAFGHDHEDDH